MGVTALSIGLCGCSGNSMPPFGLENSLFFTGVETVTLINTDKTMIDHLMSSYKGQDCSSVRHSEGGEYCVDIVDVSNADPYSDLYCYRTIGAVNCYNTPQVGYYRVDM